MCYLGIKTLLARPASEIGTDVKSIPTNGTGLAGAFASTFLLTLTNPMTILSFAAVFAGLGLAAVKTNYSSAAVLVSGVFSGSALWWFILSGGVALFRSRLKANGLLWINRASGALIAAFGVIALFSLIH